MNEKMKNAWEYIKEHKVQIGIAALATVGGVIWWKNRSHLTLMNVAQNIDKPEKLDIWPKKLDVADLGIGALDDAMRYKDGSVELWMDQISLSDMGALGEAIGNNIPDLPENSSVWALMCVKPNTET